jgi:chromosome transmission fidelity protein 18
MEEVTEMEIDLLDQNRKRTLEDPNEILEPLAKQPNIDRCDPHYGQQSGASSSGDRRSVISVTDTMGNVCFLSVNKSKDVLSKQEILLKSCSFQLNQTPFDDLKKTVEDIRYRKIMENTDSMLYELRQNEYSMDLLNDPLDAAMEEENSTEPTKSLWADKYSPKTFTELLSDDGVNRSLLSWLKLWDESVFGSSCLLKDTSNQQPNQKRRQQQQQQQQLHQQKLAYSDQVISPHSSGYASAEVNRSSDGPYTQWKDSRPNVRRDFKPLPVKHDSLNELHQYSTSNGNTFRSPSSLDRNSLSGSSQSSYTGSSTEHTSRHYHHHPSPNSSQSEYSDSHPHLRYSSSQPGNYYSLPRSRSHIPTGAGPMQLSNEEERAHQHAASMLGKVWPLEEEDYSNAIPPANTSTGVYSPRYIAPNYLPQSPTSPSSYSSDSQGLPWYEQENPNIHTGLYMPSTSGGGVTAAATARFPRPHSYHQYTTPPMGSSPPKQNQQIPSGSADRALDMMTEQKLLSQQRLERYFNQSAQRERNVSPFLRRESSPAHLGSKENQKKLYKQSPFVVSHIYLVSTSE